MTIYNTPVTIFWDVMERKSFDRLINYKKKHARKVLKVAAPIIWDKFNSQMIDEFGVSDEMKMIYYKQNTINRCELRMLLGGENQGTLIEILKSEIELIKSKIDSNLNIKKHNAKLRSIHEQKYHRDITKLSIFDFYNDIQELKKEAEERKVMESPKRKLSHG